MLLKSGVCALSLLHRRYIPWLSASLSKWVFLLSVTSVRILPLFISSLHNPGLPNKRERIVFKASLLRANLWATHSRRLQRLDLNDRSAPSIVVDFKVNWWNQGFHVMVVQGWPENSKGLCKWDEPNNSYILTVFSQDGISQSPYHFLFSPVQPDEIERYTSVLDAFIFAIISEKQPAECHDEEAASFTPARAIQSNTLVGQGGVTVNFHFVAHLYCKGECPKLCSTYGNDDSMWVTVRLSRILRTP